MDSGTIFYKREEFCNIRLREFKNRLSQIHELKELNKICIYTTGSYGRLEAFDESDIDLFFLNTDQKSVPKLKKTLVDAEIIRISTAMGLPEFSGDGEYLHIHSVKEMMEELGSPNDDYRNYFTARMLLLLESRPVYNTSLYNELVRNIIKKYYVDFNRHEENFEPIFLVNDIIRFWKTMCLNYEHKRNRRFSDSGLSDEEIKLKKNRTYLKNLKLRFSRKLTCYSFLAKIVWSNGVITDDQIFDITQQTPLQRIKGLRVHSNIREEVEESLKLYEWFMEKTQQPTDEVMHWISNASNRNDAFEKSRTFARCLYEIMRKTPNQDKLMYFLV